MRRLPVFLACAWLPGCVVGPNYVRPEVPQPPGWQVEYEAAAGMADLAWWQGFDDPTLEGLVADAVRNNLDLKVAAFRVDQYLAALQVTRAQFFPEVSGAVSPEATRQGDATVKTNRAFVAATWEVDLWGRVRRLNEAGQARVRVGEALRRGAVLSVVSDVAVTYLALRGLDRQLEIARATEQSYAETLRLFRLRFEHGDISQVDLSQAESQYELARQRVPALEADIRQGEHALSLLLGRAPGPIPRGRDLDGLKRPGIPAGLPSDLLARRPDIIQAEQELIAANADIGAAKAEYFPRLSLTGSAGAASSEIRLFTAGAGFVGAAANLVGPVFDFGRISGNVKRAEAYKEEALFNYRKAVLVGFSDVEDALVRLTKGQERLSALERQVKALGEYARLSRLQYEAGVVDYLQVQDADRQLFEGRLNQAILKANLLGAAVSVYKAMGGGWIDQADGLAAPARK